MANFELLLANQKAPAAEKGTGGGSAPAAKGDESGSGWRWVKVGAAAVGGGALFAVTGKAALWVKWAGVGSSLTGVRLELGSTSSCSNSQKVLQWPHGVPGVCIGCSSSACHGKAGIEEDVISAACGQATSFLPTSACESPACDLLHTLMCLVARPHGAPIFSLMLPPHNPHGPSRSPFLLCRRPGGPGACSWTGLGHDPSWRQRCSCRHG